MAIDIDALRAHRFAQIRQSFDARDAILYALGIGLGEDPLDEADLDHLLETRLVVLPAFVGTLASPGMWIRDPAFGIEFSKVVHAEQEVSFGAPLPTGGAVVSTPRIASIHDRGPGKGAVLVIERNIDDAGSGLRYAAIRQTLLLRGDGGFGGDPPPRLAAVEMPTRNPEHRVSFPITSRAALIYRLSGDWNPLHSDPSAARAAGFERPILHGLASYGIASYLIERTMRRRLRRLSCRFAGVVIPGETLALSLWDEQDGCRFEAYIGDRKVLDRGYAQFAS